jgi:hypothetical protein
MGEDEIRSPPVIHIISTLRAGGDPQLTAMPFTIPCPHVRSEQFKVQSSNSKVGTGNGITHTARYGSTAPLAGSVLACIAGEEAWNIVHSVWTFVEFISGSFMTMAAMLQTTICGESRCLDGVRIDWTTRSACHGGIAANCPGVRLNCRGLPWWLVCDGVDGFSRDGSLSRGYWLVMAVLKRRTIQYPSRPYLHMLLRPRNRAQDRLVSCLNEGVCPQVTSVSGICVMLHRYSTTPVVYQPHCHSFLPSVAKTIGLFLPTRPYPPKLVN